MRSALGIVGIVLIVGGMYVLLFGGSLRTREDVLDVGGIHVSASRRLPVDPWMAWAGILTGGALLAVGISKKV